MHKIEGNDNSPKSTLMMNYDSLYDPDFTIIKIYAYLHPSNFFFCLFVLVNYCFI